MRSSVPQFIDVEDKIVGPFTWKQLGWMIVLMVTLILLRLTLGTTLSIVIGIPVVLLFLAFAFYKPNGFPMTTFIAHAIFFLFRPKMAVWERPISAPVSVAPSTTAPKEQDRSNEEKQLNRGTLKELARIIDSQRDR